MSNIYIYEPATNGKVVLETTMGDIEIELWSKEAPKACRNFIALIMEGYYDGQIFHRIVQDFIVQTGDPTGTGNGGESFYGEPFEDEPHQRLKFSRRGLVGMANNQVRNSNTSQFFITLNQTPELQGKHVSLKGEGGDTILTRPPSRLSETDASERPLYPPKIKSIKILDNPFDDIVVRITAAERRKQEARRRESAREREEMAGRKKVKK
ncbi:cyclophilin-like domain-containing protein [Mrakia frigida]|uniref:cyclophilin-like domain-containing protein n=1 Tax=Mrakia frigida TaxID=29902 RepID=UPI003FCC0AF9